MTRCIEIRDRRLQLRRERIAGELAVFLTNHGYRIFLKTKLGSEQEFVEGDYTF